MRSVLPLRTSHSLYAFYGVRPAHPCQQKKQSSICMLSATKPPRGAKRAHYGAALHLQFPNLSTRRRLRPVGGEAARVVPLGTVAGGHRHRAGEQGKSKGALPLSCPCFFLCYSATEWRGAATPLAAESRRHGATFCARILWAQGGRGATNGQRPRCIGGGNRLCLFGRRLA